MPTTIARWRKRTLADRAAEASAGKKGKKKAERDAFDDQIDAELEKL